MDLGEKEFKKLTNFETEFNDSLQLLLELKTIRDQLISASYLGCSIDSVIRDSNSFTAFVQVGMQFQLVRLKPGNVEEEILSRSGFRERVYSYRPFNPKQVDKLLNRIIIQYENNGYPFAVVKLDSVYIDDEGVTASLKLQKNILVKIDSVRIYGSSKVSEKYIHNYLDIKPGDFYSEKLVRRVDNRLSELPFVSQAKPHTIAFTKTKSYLNLYLDKRNANRFDGIVGFLPNEETGKVEFTGDVKLKLQNSFNRGELLNFNWRRLVNQSQDLKVKFNYPYLFNTPFGIDFDFKLYRRDTTFLDVYLKYGIQYLWSANNYIEVFLHDKNSNLLSTSQYTNATVLPSFADINSTLYGLAVNFEQLDYRLNPRKGVSFYLEAEVGRKKIRRNNELNPEIYEGLDLNTNLYNLSASINYFIPLSRVMVLMLGNQSAYTFNENIFENELNRIGGLLILRGFDEESIFTSLYTVNTLEYRILLEKNSFWYLFFNGAYYENNNVALENKITDTPFGFGTGITFETNAGIFSINYALGKQFSNPIIFRAAKIHFGFVNYF